MTKYIGVALAATLLVGCGASSDQPTGKPNGEPLNTETFKLSDGQSLTCVLIPGHENGKLGPPGTWSCDWKR